jgi:hypothetical protein
VYEVSIDANPEDFLDWDKPLSQQSEAVRASLEPLKSELAARHRPGFVDDEFPASGLIRGLSKDEMGGSRNASDVSTKLREAGIPGIKYLDGMSRGQGEGSSNYVVFDDALIEILRKYANPVTGAIPGLAAQTQDGTDPQTITTANILKFLRGHQ